MSFTIWVLLSIATLVISCENIPSQSVIYGVWEGKYLKKDLKLNFNSDGTCVIKIKDETSGSVDIVNGNFIMDFSKNPIPISIRNIPQLNHPLHTIVEIVNPDLIKLGNFVPSWRVRNISFDKNKIIILKRMNTIQ